MLPLLAPVLLYFFKFSWYKPTDWLKLALQKLISTNKVFFLAQFLDVVSNFLALIVSEAASRLSSDICMQECLAMLYVCMCNHVNFFFYLLSSVKRKMGMRLNNKECLIERVRDWLYHLDYKNTYARIRFVDLRSAFNYNHPTKTDIEQLWQLRALTNIFTVTPCIPGLCVEHVAAYFRRFAHCQCPLLIPGQEAKAKVFIPKVFIWLATFKGG